jgi:hypothetical protein
MFAGVKPERVAVSDQVVLEQHLEDRRLLRLHEARDLLLSCFHC